jgi:hypothetical protein
MMNSFDDEDHMSYADGESLALKIAAIMNKDGEDLFQPFSIRDGKREAIPSFFQRVIERKIGKQDPFKKPERITPDFFRKIEKRQEAKRQMDLAAYPTASTGADISHSPEHWRDIRERMNRILGHSNELDLSFTCSPFYIKIVPKLSLVEVELDPAIAPLLRDMDGRYSIPDPLIKLGVKLGEQLEKHFKNAAMNAHIARIMKDFVENFLLENKLVDLFNLNPFKPSPLPITPEFYNGAWGCIQNGIPPFDIDRETKAVLKIDILK